MSFDIREAECDLLEQRVCSTVGDVSFWDAPTERAYILARSLYASRWKSGEKPDDHESGFISGFMALYLEFFRDGICNTKVSNDHKTN